MVRLSKSWKPEQSHERAAARQFRSVQAKRRLAIAGHVRQACMHARKAPKLKNQAFDRVFKAQTQTPCERGIEILHVGCGSRYSIAAAWSAAKGRFLRPD
jgi:hypothetical protein